MTTTSARLDNSVTAPPRDGWTESAQKLLPIRISVIQRGFWDAASIALFARKGRQGEPDAGLRVEAHLCGPYTPPAHTRTRSLASTIDASMALRKFAVEKRPDASTLQSTGCHRRGRGLDGRLAPTDTVGATPPAALRSRATLPMTSSSHPSPRTVTEKPSAVSRVWSGSGTKALQNGSSVLNRSTTAMRHARAASG